MQCVPVTKDDHLMVTVRPGFIGMMKFQHMHDLAMCVQVLVSARFSSSAKDKIWITADVCYYIHIISTLQ